MGRQPLIDAWPDWFEVIPNERWPELMMECYRVLKKDTHAYFLADEEAQDYVYRTGTAWNQPIPPGTAGFEPLSFPSTNLVAGAEGSASVPSAKATAPRASPAAISGRYFAARSALPAATSAWVTP